MKKTHRSAFPTLNVKRISEPAAKEVVCCDAPTIYDGSKCAQEFLGTKTLVSNVCGMKHVKQLVNSLEDNIRQRGAM